MPRSKPPITRGWIYSAALLAAVGLSGGASASTSQSANPLIGRLNSARKIRFPQERLNAIVEVMHACHAASDRFAEAECAYAAGGVLASTYNWSRAVSFYESAANLYEGLKDSRDAGVAFHQAGFTAENGNDRVGALKFFQRALPAETKSGDVAGRAATMLSIGGVYDDLGEPSEAVKACKMARELFRKADPRREAVALNYIGRIDEELGLRHEALGIYRSALPLAVKFHDGQAQAETLTNMGVTFENLGRQAEALDSFKKALSLWGNNLRGRSATLNDLGKTAKESGHYEQALAFYNRALDLQVTSHDAQGQALSLNNIGRTDVELGRSREALGQYRRALELERQTGRRDAEAITLRNTGYAWSKLGEPGLAIAVAKQSVNTFQGLRAELRSFKREVQQSYATEVAPAYRFLADQLISRGRLAEAEEVMGLLKDEEYFRFIRAGKSENVDLTPREAEWRNKYEALGGDLAQKATEYDTLVALSNAGGLKPEQESRKNELASQLSAAREAFSAFLSGATSMFEASTADRDRLTELKSAGELAKVVRALPERPAAIYTLVTEDGVRTILTLPHVTELTEGKSMAIRFPDLCRKIDALRTALRDPTLDPIPAASELFDILVRPIQPELKAAGVQSLMWSLDGPLRYIPIGALYDRVTKKYLVDEYATSLFTPAQVVDLVATPNAGAQAVGFGVSKPHQVGKMYFPGLTGVSAELSSLHRILGAPVYEDAAFTESALRDSLEKRPGLVHLATHFQLDPGDAAKSFLLLGDGKPLSISAFDGWMQNSLDGVDLFVLSACDTATPAGNDADGGEIESFSRTAQANGAAAVLATLWPVNDVSTSAFMAKFYELRAKKGLSKLDALREAQRWLMGATSVQVGSKERGSALKRAGTGDKFKFDPSHPYAHPFYWAPFVLTGNTR